MPTQSWSGKSAVFLMESALTSHGSSKLDGRGISDYRWGVSYFTVRVVEKIGSWTQTSSYNLPIREIHYNFVLSEFVLHLADWIKFLLKKNLITNLSWRFCRNEATTNRQVSVLFKIPVSLQEKLAAIPNEHLFTLNGCHVACYKP